MATPPPRRGAHRSAASVQLHPARSSASGSSPFHANHRHNPSDSAVYAAHLASAQHFQAELDVSKYLEDIKDHGGPVDDDYDWILVVRVASQLLRAPKVKTPAEPPLPPCDPDGEVSERERSEPAFSSIKLQQAVTHVAAKAEGWRDSLATRVAYEIGEREAFYKFQDDGVYQRVRAAGLCVAMLPLHVADLVLFKIRAPRARLQREMPGAELACSSERVSLIQKILYASVGDGGADVRDFERRKIVLASFPRHKPGRLQALEDAWLPQRSLLHTLFHATDQPLSEICEYLGEEPAMYSAWLSFTARFLIVPALFGLALFIAQMRTRSIDHLLAPVYTALVATWFALLPWMWFRKTAGLMTRWRKELRLLRRQISALHSKSLCGSLGCFFMSFTLIGGVALGVALLMLTIFRESDERFRALEDDEDRIFFAFSSFIVPFVYALVQPFVDALVTALAFHLTEWEGWSSELEQQWATALKVVPFRAFHSIGPLAYYAFAESSTQRLAAQVTAVHLGNLASDWLGFFAGPWLRRQWNRSALLEQRVKDNSDIGDAQRAPAGAAARDADLPAPWVESLRPKYDASSLWASDVVSLATLVFSFAFPLLPAISFVSTVLQVRAHKWLVTRMAQRPTPRRFDAGRQVWGGFLVLQTVLSVCVGGLLIAWRSSAVEEWLGSLDTCGRVVVFFVVEHIVLVLSGLAALLHWRFAPRATNCACEA